ncbi:MAG: glycoside hydrolase domain-containing protein [Chitinophagaceae bacterium]
MWVSGMDDAGEMSAWYVFSALGLYPFFATDAEYIVTVPIFDEIKWQQNNGKTLTIKKSGNSRNISSIVVNGKNIDDYFVSHHLFKDGGEINIKTR